METEYRAESVNSREIRQLLSELHAIREKLVANERKLGARLALLDPARRQSAANLIHYVTLRGADIRPLQEKLAALGLSSLGRAESHVMNTLDNVLKLLCAVAGEKHASPVRLAEVPSFAAGSKLLEANADRLLGSRPAGRSVRIMVTMPAEAGEDYPLVRDLVRGGMNCMRINCAHDNPDAWARMAEHLRRAVRETGLQCRVLMDVAGPKFRTGDVEPGPRVLVWRPTRNIFGEVTSPARIWLTPKDDSTPSAVPVDASLPVDRDWIALCTPGDRIDFEDTRGASRVLRIVESVGDCRLAESRQTCYVGTGTALFREDDSAEVGDLPRVPNTILLHERDRLVLTRSDEPGSNAVFDDNGKLVSPAHVGCSLHEVFSQARPGEPIWFDDGKIGGVIKAVSPDAIEVEITQARVKGSRLGADKGINLPETDIHLPALTRKDIEDLGLIVKIADIVGMSFVRSENDVRELTRYLKEAGRSDMGIILKIETRHAFECLPDLLLALMYHPVGGVMIARGDLAVECGYERLAEIQEEILWICEAAHTPVIWATQVLENLAKKGQASRAEITDAAMGERAECVMLNKGPHIVEAVRALDSILHRMQGHQVKKTSMMRRLHLRAHLEEE